jgi:hypothetical protein
VYDKMPFNGRIITCLIYYYKNMGIFLLDEKKFPYFFEDSGTIA